MASSLPSAACKKLWGQRVSLTAAQAHRQPLMSRLMLSCKRAYPRGERGGRRCGAHRLQQPRARSPGRPPTLVVGISYLHRASFTPTPPLQVFKHRFPLPKNFASQTAMISVRMIMFIKMIIFCPNKLRCPKVKTLQAKGLQRYPHGTLPGSALDKLMRLTEGNQPCNNTYLVFPVFILRDSFDARSTVIIMGKSTLSGSSFPAHTTVMSHPCASWHMLFCWKRPKFSSSDECRLCSSEHVCAAGLL